MSSPDKYTSLFDRFSFAESTVNVAVRNLLEFTSQYLQSRIDTWRSANELLEVIGLYEGPKNFPEFVGSTNFP